MDGQNDWLNRRKGKRTVDSYKLDTTNKTAEENLIDIIQGLYLNKPVKNDTSPTNRTSTDFKAISGLRHIQRSSSDNYRLSYLNALVTLLCKTDRAKLGFTADELMSCIRISLVDESMVIRTTALKVLRHLIKTESDVAIFNNLKLPYLVMRSIDLIVRNEEERTQALRVVRRVICVVGAEGATRRPLVHEGLLRCLTAVARAGCTTDGSGDRLARPAAATLAEICIVNADQFMSMGGVSAVMRQLGECATPRMAEALCGVLLHSLNTPASRLAARIDLTYLTAPYCDFHMRPSTTDSNRDEREMRFTCSRLALLCVLRSWPGLLHFCQPSAPGGLRALVTALYLPRLEVRKAILDLLYELVGLPQPEWTDEISVALDAVDPSDFQDSWRLNEGFVAAEGIAILPHLSATGPDITEIHLALLLQCFLEAGLLDGLAEVIVTSDTFISVRATVLLGQLLHLVHQLVPVRLCGAAPLRALACGAASGSPQALAAVAALRRLRDVLQARPAASSLFLDHAIQCCTQIYAYDAPLLPPSTRDSTATIDEIDEPRQRHSVGSRADVLNRNVNALVKSKSVSSRTSAAVNKVTKTTKFFNLFERDSDCLIRNTLVMQNKDGNSWDWEKIRTILKENDSSPFLNLNDSAHKAWAARIINYLKPSSNKYSHTDLSTTAHGHTATRAGCQLIRHLLRHDDVDSHQLLEDLFLDVSRQIAAIETGRKAHECLFSPQHMCNTMCQMYFLFIGQLCHTHTGLKLFKSTKLYENLLELSTNTHHSCYVKLVISSLDYTIDSYPRDILAKTLTCNIQASRLYVTQFLNVLLRASQKSREMVRRKSKLKSSFIQENVKSQKKNKDSDSVDMEMWVLQMLVGQIKDECKAIVKCALSILEEAYSVPAYMEKLMSIRSVLGHNCQLDKAADPNTLDIGAAGDRGYLLWLCLEVNAASTHISQDQNNFLKKHIEFWTKTYNFRYVRLVESCVHEALTLSGVRGVGGGGGGGGAWGMEGAGGVGARGRRSARPPPHLHAALAAVQAAGRPPDLLAHVLPQHYKIIQRKSCTTEQEIMELKSSLWALGHTAVNCHGLQLLMNLSDGYLDDSVPVHIVRLAKYSPVYSIRATALYVLGLVGSTYDGANLLAELGWLCVRNTRHEQFPIIQDEIYPPIYESSNWKMNSVTSPDARRYTFDADLSEHSDHTDLSVAESLPSDSSKIKAIDQEIKDQDVVDHMTNALPHIRKEPDKRKSHTLPTQGSTHDRPLLSESRTVDILKDYSNYEVPGPNRIPIPENRLLIGRMNSMEHAHEGRVRNTSESSTSGVSSCDSFLGKYAIPERIVTLSPIPSSSSLYGMKSSSSSQRPRVSETQRRISTSSFTAPDSASSPPTQMDITGYATLKALNKHRRPHLSEGAASGSSDKDDYSWLLTDTNRRSKPFSSLRDRTKSARERMAKQSILSADWRPLGAEAAARAAAAGGGPAPAVPPRAPAAPAHALYRGICLPKHLLDIFPIDQEQSERIESENKELVKRIRIPSFIGDSSNASTEHRSRATPDSQKISSRGSTKQSNTSTSNQGVASFTPYLRPTESTHKTAPLNTAADILPTASSFTSNIDTSNKQATKTSSTAISNKDALDTKEARKMSIEVKDGLDQEKLKDTGKWKHLAAECLACVRTRPPSSHELREAFFSELDPEVTIKDCPSPELSSPQAEVLRHAHCMSNPIHFKQTRSAIISLKQRHPEIFHSVCLYSDVCALLARDTYMLCARRFLQDQFLDTNFNCFNDAPAAILERHVPKSLQTDGNIQLKT